MRADVCDIRESSFMYSVRANTHIKTYPPHIAQQETKCDNTEIHESSSMYSAQANAKKANAVKSRDTHRHQLSISTVTLCSGDLSQYYAEGVSVAVRRRGVESVLFLDRNSGGD